MNRKLTSAARNQDAEPALTPKLRFPEFRDAAGWEKTKLGTALKFQAGFPFPSSGFNESGDGLRLIRNRDLKSDDKVIYFSADFESDFVVDNGDILIGMDGDFTPCVWSKGRALLNQRVGRIIPKGKNDRRFFFYFLTLALKTIEDATARTTVKHLSHSEVEKLDEPIATIPEQQKIAECLTTLDEVIAAQSQKIDALKTHKKGLMQQLFPGAPTSSSAGKENADGDVGAPSETLPRLRFPEFQAAPEWDLRLLGRVAENLDNRRVPVTSGVRTAGDVPYYGASGVVDHVEGFIFDEDLLCVSEDGANLVARTYPIAFPISGKTWVNNHAHVLRFKKACTQKFVEVYLNSIKLDDFITGMAQPKLNKAMLDSIPIPYPDILEQQRIADCLTTLDDLITAQSAKLAVLKTHKKGLMQQLFPSPEEVEA